MKTNTTVSSKQYAKNMDVSVMGISEENLQEKLAQVSAIFRDSIYANKTLAPVRELITNAVDEHLRHCPKVPVDVKIEQDTDGKYYWSVRDYALGLSTEKVQGVLGMLLESTKNQDNVDMGGFGVGAKSFFAYTEFAYITSYFGGIKRVFAAFVDAEAGGVGKIGIIHEEPTEETGIEVKFEIKKSDINEFKNHTTNYIKNSRSSTYIDFYYLGSQIPFVELKYKSIQFKNFAYTYQEEVGADCLSHNISRWNLPEGVGRIKIRIGDVVYPYDTSIDSLDKDYHSGYFDVPIGYLTLPISREAINDNPINNEKIRHMFSTVKKHRDTQEFRIKRTILDLAENTRSHVAPYFWDVNSCGIRVNRLFNRHDATHIFNDSSILLDPKKKSNVVVVIPDNRAKHTWIDRLKEFVASDASKINYFYVIKGDGKTEDPKIKEEIDKVVSDGVYQIQYIRSLKIPSNRKKGDKKEDRVFSFRGRSSYDNCSLSIKEFNEKHKKNRTLADCKTFNEVKAVCITNKKYRYYDIPCWYMCKTAFDLLKESGGWYVWESDEVKERMGELEREARERNAKQAAIQNLSRNTLLSKRTRHILRNLNEEKQAEKSEKILKAIDSLKSKNYLVEKFLKFDLTHWANSDILSRVEQKQIIKKLCQN